MFSWSSRRNSSIARQDTNQSRPFKRKRRRRRHQQRLPLNEMPVIEEPPDEDSMTDDDFERWVKTKERAHRLRLLVRMGVPLMMMLYTFQLPISTYQQSWMTGSDTSRENGRDDERGGIDSRSRRRNNHSSIATMDVGANEKGEDSIDESVGTDESRLWLWQTSMKPVPTEANETLKGDDDGQHKNKKNNSNTENDDLNKSENPNESNGKNNTGIDDNANDDDDDIGNNTSTESKATDSMLNFWSLGDRDQCSRDLRISFAQLYLDMLNMTTFCNTKGMSISVLPREPAPPDCPRIPFPVEASKCDDYRLILDTADETLASLEANDVGSNASMTADTTNGTMVLNRTIQNEKPRSIKSDCWCTHPFRPTPMTRFHTLDRDASPVYERNILWANGKNTTAYLDPDVVMYGDSITEQFGGMLAGVDRRKFRGPGVVFLEHFTKQGGANFTALPLGVMEEMVRYE